MLYFIICLNIFLFIAVIGLIISSIYNKSQADVYHDQWSKWEARYYKMQGILSEEYQLESHIDGLESELTIEPRKYKED